MHPRIPCQLCSDLPRALFSALLVLGLVGCSGREEPAVGVLDAGSSVAPRYVGSNSCRECHDPYFDMWKGSHHDLAMQPATKQTVLGDFDDAEMIQYGVVSRFYTRDGRFFVNTEGSDGVLRDYEVRYTFGVTPLQQYLVAFPDGRYQVLPTCWDTRPADEGGQRWFHVYPDEHIPPGDELHWTGPNQNWNYMCAECHSTDLKRNYDLAENRYDTTWSEISVGCEACHGPGSDHLQWAQEKPNSSDGDGLGLPIDLTDPASRGWVLDPGAVTARRVLVRESHTEIETCAPCHARRTTFEEGGIGKPFLDTHLPALLDERFYHADGQILDEVYVYGSFVQSKMFGAGVTCSDCHEPHGLQVRAPGNSLCARCHIPDTFDTPEHHFHLPDSPGAQCVACHMPEKTYMVVDPRRDHSLRVPRPDISERIGVPNACNGCHADETAQWAAMAIDQHSGREWRSRSHFGEALHAARSGHADAMSILASLIEDPDQPGIAIATALSMLPPATDARGSKAIATGLESEDPLVRIAALGALEQVPAPERIRLGARLLDDPIRTVRMAASRTLADAQLQSGSLQSALDRAVDEYIDAQMTNAERPESHMNIGNLRARRGDWLGAEASYGTALRLAPAFAPAAVNLADLYRRLGRDSDGEPVLRTAIERDPASAAAHHSLGLLLVRTGRMEEGVASLGEAARLAPDGVRYRFVFAVALGSTDQVPRAIAELEAVLEDHPGDPEILAALASYCHQSGAIDRAIEYAGRLVARLPGDPGALQMLRQLEALRDP